MAKIFLVRHGETDWNREQRVLGWSNVPLNATGLSQVKELACFLSILKIDAIYSSPLPRTLQTAQILGSAMDLGPIVEPRFTEANIGSWEGRLWKELENDPIKQKYYTHPTTARPPNGETSSEVRGRAVSGIDELCRQQPDGSLLVVTHADLIRCILSHYLGIDIKIARRFWIDHASLSLISPDEKDTMFYFLNLLADRSRLSGLRDGMKLIHKEISRGQA